MVEQSPEEGKDWNVGDNVFDAQGIPAIIAYVGETKFKPGKWIGLVFDRPIGKNNGTVEGVKYFECEENHGRFVRENQISSVDKERRGSSATSLSGSTTSLHSTTEPLSARSEMKKPGRPSLAGIKPPSTLPKTGKATTSTSQLPASGLAKPGSSRPSLAPATPQVKPSLVPASESKAPKQTTMDPPRSVAVKEKIGKIPLSEPFTSPERLRSTSFEQPDNSSGDVRHESMKPDTDSASTSVKIIQESAEHAKARRDQEMEIAKLRIQVEQLEFHKARMGEVHSDLQKQLDAARREAREAADATNSDEIADLRDIVESISIDKETAEEKRDQLARELDDLKLKHEETALELEVLQHEVKEGGHGDASANYRVVELQKHNDKLRDGLIQLGDMLAKEKREKQQLEKQVKTLEDLSEELRKTVEKSQTEAARTGEVIAELREQVDAALGSEEMVERLAEQKLDMEDKLHELQDTVTDYESMANFDKEMIELNTQSARKLREELDMAKSESGQLTGKIDQLQQVISDSSVTLHKFRDLTQQLQKENSSLREQLQLNQTSSTQQTPTTPMTIDFRLKIQDEKTIADRVNHRMLDISGKILAKRLGYLSLFLPDLYAANREDAFVNICLIPEQIGLKLSLIGDEVNQKFDVPSTINQSSLDAMGMKRRDEVIYALSFNFFLKIVDTWNRDIDHAIRCASPDAFSVLNEMESRLQRQDDSIQYYVDLLKQSRLDEITSLEYLETSAGQMLLLMSRLSALECVQRSRMEKLKDVMDIFTAASRVISAVSCGLCIGLKNHGPEVTKWLTEFIHRSDNISDVTRKIKRPLDIDNELRAVMLPDHVQTQLRPLVESIQRVAGLCYAWYKMVGHQASLQAADHGTMDGITVKNILNSENDRGGFYKSPVVSPQQSMLNALDESLGILRQFSKEIDDGEWTRGALKAPEMPKLHPLRLRADLLKKSLADAEELKSKIAAKDEEILEIRKNYRAKLEEVSELQLRRSLTEKKLVSASKTEDEKNSKLLTLNMDLSARLSKLQQDYDNECAHLRSQVELLESDKHQMEDKLKQTSKRFLSVDMAPTKSTGKGGSGDHNVEGQVELLRQVIATLRADVVAVKAEQVRRDLDEKLPPLKVPVTSKRNIHFERVGKLKRQLNELEMQRFVMFARTAVDLTQPKAERDKLIKERRMEEEEFQLKIRKINIEIAELMGPGRLFCQDATKSS